MNQLINRNVIWAQVFADRLVKAKIKNILISPGSRNTPLIFAFSGNKYFNIKVIVDERTNGFFALGLSKANAAPTVIVTTSGTAVAELYPAIIEAYQQRISLIICTADRPKYLRNTGANQTINQTNIYKNHIKIFFDMGLPTADSFHLEKFSHKVDKVIAACRYLDKGPVHINFQFEKPFEPDSFTDSISKETIKSVFAIPLAAKILSGTKLKLPDNFIFKLKKGSSGLIFCGGGSFENTFGSKIVKLSNQLNYPIIADGTSPLRYGKCSKNNVIVNAAAFLKNEKIARSVNPKIILQFGKAPTSNTLLQFFKKSSAEKYVVNESGDLHDPSRTVKRIFKVPPEQFIDMILSHSFEQNSLKNNLKKYFRSLELKSEKVKTSIIYKAAFPFEGRIINEIINSIPNNSNLVISNSTPVRDVDFFSPASKKNISVFTNRGASGIDGVISTSLGIAAANTRPTFLIIGDLAFYHDLNSLQIAKKYDIPLTIILVDNNGGGIFNMLPVKDYKNVFDKYFKTELNIDFKFLVKGFGGDYSLIKSWNSLNSKLNDLHKDSKFSVLHIKTDSEKSLAIRKRYWALVGKELR